MKQLCLMALALALILSAGNRASAFDALPEDQIEVQSCIEGVRDYNSSAGPDDRMERDSCIDVVARPCLESDVGQSTVGMAQCQEREMAVWDGMLNDAYRSLREVLPKTKFGALREAQLKWIAFRDANCAWPHVIFEGGTMAFPMAAACMKDMTARRANELADYLDWMPY